MLRLQKKRNWKNVPGNELQSRAMPVYQAKRRYGGTASEKIAGSGDLLLRIERKNFWFLIAWIKERIKNP